ncbi:MAG: hypothetical protein KDE53_35325, partial [Caldilineaceae bacterium]|nr:hypothetical protein [Caldilineaceae bacterium]
TRTHHPRPAHVAVLGNPVRDAYLAVDAIDFATGRVSFQRGTAAFDIAYQGAGLRFGEKREAQCDLSTLDLAPFTIGNGGGVYHTATQLAQLCRQRALPVALTAIEIVTPWPELTAAYTQWGIHHRSLALEPSTTNFILTNGQPDRLILKSPSADSVLTAPAKAALRRQLVRGTDLLVVNSVRSVDLARTVMDEAQRRRIPQYSVLTPSLALNARIALQLQRDRASVCNLSEFALIAAAFGIDCPAHEEGAAVEDVAAVMATVAAQCHSGDLVVTLGGRGCLVGERASGMVRHVVLTDGYRQQVQAYVQAQPACKNGVGDRFFGAFVLAHAFGGTRCTDRTARAAGWASLQMVRQLAPGLAAQRSWVKLTPVLNGYGRGCLHRYSLTRSVRLNQLPQPSRKSASMP